MNTLIYKQLWPAAVLLVLPLMGLTGSAAEPENGHAQKMAQSLKLFNGQVRTIFSEHCVRCHGGEKTRSDFDLATRRGLLAGGELGVAVVPGKPAELSLIHI